MFGWEKKEGTCRGPCRGALRRQEIVDVDVVTGRWGKWGREGETNGAWVA